jgi:hypothetical protein
MNNLMKTGAHRGGGAMTTGDDVGTYIQAKFEGERRVVPFTRPTVVKSHASCRLDRSRPTAVVCPKISSNTFRRALTSLNRNKKGSKGKRREGRRQLRRSTEGHTPGHDMVEHCPVHCGHMVAW